jgi:REP element-mobilizing transposase RayT
MLPPFLFSSAKKPHAATCVDNGTLRLIHLCRTCDEGSPQRVGWRKEPGAAALKLLLSFSCDGTIYSVVAVYVPHHLTQRRNGRRFILDCDADRKVYLSLWREITDLYDVPLIGYCLMSNHVHLIAVPRKADGLAQPLKQTHGRYASYWNAAHLEQGHNVSATGPSVRFLLGKAGQAE